MRTKVYSLFIGLISILFVNCSSSDDDSNSSSNQNYFPLVINNEWDYENTRTISGNEEVFDETIVVENSLTNQENTSFTLNSTAEQGDVSFTSVLSNGELYKTNNKLFLTGSVNLGLDQVEIPGFDIDFQDLVVYDAQAVENTILFTENQDLDLPEFNNINLSLNINIESKSLGSFQNFDANNEIYDEVIGSEFTVKMGIDATTTVAGFPLPITIPVLEFQEVVNSTNYFANEIGLVQSETNLNVDFSDEISQIPNLNLQDISSLIQQSLIAYQVSLEEEN